MQQWITKNRSNPDRLIALGLFLAALLLFTINLGGLPLRDWDEGLVAQVAREIWRSDFDSLTWLYPQMWGEPYFNKPPLMHTLTAGFYAIGGVNEWTARLPSAILTAISVPLLYSVGREVFYLRLPAIFTALVYLTLLPVVRQGRLAMLDGAILCFLILMMACVLKARRDSRYLLGFGIGFGLLCLIKGVMVGGLLATIALLFIGWDTPRLLRLPHLWIGLFLGGIPAMLWYGAQVAHYGQGFLGTNLVNQSLQRIWTDVENNRGAPWYYLLEILKYTAPWLLFLPLAVKHAWEHRNWSWAKLAIVWGGVYLIAISLMATKLPWYVLPLYPAMALLVGAELAELWKKGYLEGSKFYPEEAYSPWWRRWFLLLAIGCGAGAIYFLSLSVPHEPDVGVMAAGLSITFLLAAILVNRQNPQFIVVLLWGTYVVLMMLMTSSHWVWELAESYPVKPVAALVQQAPPDAKIYTSYPYGRPSLNFYSDRPVFPAKEQQLKRVWRRNLHPYLLLDNAAMTELKLQDQQIIGTASGWSLVTKKEN